MTISPSGRVKELLAQVAGEQTVEGGAFALIQALDSAKNDPAYETTGERDRYIFALTAIAEYLLRCGREDLALWIAELGSAMSDLDTGIVRPCFEPTQIDSRPSDSSDKWRGRATIAVAVDLLILSGLTRTAAADKIEKEFPELVALVGSKKRLGASALSWRDEFRKRRVSNVQAVRSYAELKTMLAVTDIDSTGALAAAEDLLRRAAGEIHNLTG